MNGRGHGCKLSLKCHTAVTALLTTSTIKAAAKKVGVSEWTLRCWQRVHEFSDMLREARQQAFAHALGRIQAEADRAVDVLVKVLTKRKGDDRTKLKAAVALLSHGFKAAELHDLAERIAAVEAELSSPERLNGRLNAVNGRARV
jgi:hypothetical protein